MQNNVSPYATFELIMVLKAWDESDLGCLDKCSSRI